MTPNTRNPRDVCESLVTKTIVIEVSAMSYYSDVAHYPAVPRNLEAARIYSK